MSNAINELRAWLNTELGASFFMDEAPDDAEYPYKVGRLGPSYENEDGISETFSFDVDYWNFGKGYVELYDMAFADRGDGGPIDPSGLDHRRVQLDHGYAFITFGSFLPVEDPDRALRRLRASYDIRLYHTR